MDYSLLIMVAAGMMMMATGDDFPLRQGAEMGLDWFSVATEPCGGGTSNLGLLLMVSLFIGFFGVGFMRRWAPVSCALLLHLLVPCRRGESSPVAIFINPATTTMRRE